MIISQQSHPQEARMNSSPELMLLILLGLLPWTLLELLNSCKFSIFQHLYPAGDGDFNWTAVPGAASFDASSGVGMLFHDECDFKYSMMALRKFLAAQLLSVTKHGRAPDAAEVVMRVDIEFPSMVKLLTEYASIKENVDEHKVDAKEFSGENLQNWGSPDGKRLTKELDNLMI